MAQLARNILAEAVNAKQPKAKEWFFDEAKGLPLPFMSSFDIRDSGYKIAPVDSNLFPAGFNNICGRDLETAPKIIKAFLKDPLPEKVLLIPESHTQNLFYLENVYYLTGILEECGFEVRIGWYNPDQTLKEPTLLKTQSGKEITIHPTEINNGRIRAGDFDPDLVVLNNDFSSGYPRALDQVTQKIMPSHKLGWHTRRKWDFFNHYNEIAKKFSDFLGVDPWTLEIQTQVVESVDFQEGQGIEQLAQTSQQMLDSLKQKYKAMGIVRDPTVFIKSNVGTYGMGIMNIRSGEELLQMNRRDKNKMSQGKNRIPIRSVLVQEGIPTSIIFRGNASEPVIYCLGCQLLGGFLRSNTERSDEENLNSKGMIFKTLCTSDLEKILETESPGQDLSKELRFRLFELVYGTIAKLSVLATAKEILHHSSN